MPEPVLVRDELNKPVAAVLVNIYNILARKAVKAVGVPLKALVLKAEILHIKLQLVKL